MGFTKKYIHTKINGKWKQVVVNDGVMYDTKGKRISRKRQSQPDAKQISSQVGGALNAPKTPVDPTLKKGSHADLSPEGVAIQNGHLFVKQRQAPNQVQEHIINQRGGSIKRSVPQDPAKKERQRRAILEKMNRNLMTGRKQTGGRVSILI